MMMKNIASKNNLAICLIRIEAFCTKNEDFDQICLNTGSTTQNVEKLSLYLIFFNNFW